MKWLLLLIFALGQVSCTYTALAPIASPAGEPIAIRVPDVPVGGKARPSQLLAIDEELLFPHLLLQHALWWTLHVGTIPNVLPLFRGVVVVLLLVVQALRVCGWGGG